MAHRILDRVQEYTTTTGGTGSLTLAGAVSKMLTFASQSVATGDTFWGLIEHTTAAEWEIALCTYTSTGAGSITRATPLKSSAALNAAVNFSSGVKTVSIVPPAAVLTLLGTLEMVNAPVIAAGALALDMLLGTVHKVALTGNVTSLSFANVLPGFASSFTVEFTANGTPYAVTQPGTVTMLNGTYTPSSTNGKRDLLNYVTLDGGTTWLCSIIAQNY